MTAALAPETVTPAALLALLDGIERHGLNAPAALAFRSALARKGREAHAAGGSQALDELQREVALADPTKADPRTAILRAVWADLP